jgi:hypothetical protein
MGLPFVRSARRLIAGARLDSSTTVSLFWVRDLADRPACTLSYVARLEIRTTSSLLQSPKLEFRTIIPNSKWMTPNGADAKGCDPSAE